MSHFNEQSYGSTKYPERAIQKGDWTESKKFDNPDSSQTQFGDLPRKNTWSRTYRKIFRQFLEDETPIDYTELRREEMLDLSAAESSRRNTFSYMSQQHIEPIEIVFEEEVPFSGHQRSPSDSAEHNHGCSMRNITRNVMLYAKQCAATEHTTGEDAKTVLTGNATAIKSLPLSPPPPAPAPPPPPPPPPLPSLSHKRLASGSENMRSNGIISQKSLQQSTVHFGNQTQQSKIERNVGYGTSNSTNDGKCNDGKNVLQVLLISPSAQQWNRTMMHRSNAGLSINPERVRDSGSVIHEQLSTLTSSNETTMLPETTISDRYASIITQPKFMTSSSRIDSDTILSSGGVNVPQRNSDVISLARNSQQAEYCLADSHYHSDDVVDQKFKWNDTRFGGTSVEQSAHKIHTISRPPQFIEAKAFISTSQPEEPASLSKRTISIPTQTETLINHRSSSNQNRNNRQLSCSDEKRNYNEQQNVPGLIRMFEESNGSCSYITKISQAHTKVNKRLNEFMGSYFGNDRPLTIRIREESDIPLQHYWSVKATIDNNEKDADVILEQLLTFIPGCMESSSCSPHKATITSNSLKHNESDFHEYKRMMENANVHSEGFIGTSKQRRNPNAQYATSINETQALEGNHLSTYQRFHGNIPLDRSELYALKCAHCRLVIPRENQLQKLKRESVVVGEDGSASYGTNETIVKQIEAELLEDYKHYQDLLEHVRVINDPYTQLAFLIMRADAAWYTAKVTKNARDRRRQYSLAKKRYGELLEKGIVALKSNDRSLLKILEKLSTILAEYPDQQDNQLKNLCRQELRNAEAAICSTIIDDDCTAMIHNIKEMLECCDFFY